ncbi:TfuA-like protein (plasmid) [Streptomyces xanthophaeus]|uniref:TfuA-like protein n=1 Tax=Streptomyces xanthophaeus TaxID=67385 RepID=UPI00398FC07D
MAVHVFAGPTIKKADIFLEINDCIVHPPIRHGDLFSIGVQPEDFILMIDGLYHGHEPIRHKEILRTMSRGVVVAGAASMGALRAAELHSYGMLGFGRVFEMYRTGEIDADDEVAVLHTDDPDGSALSEALVNMRHALRLAGEEGLVDEREAAALLETARALPYARRSWRAVERELAGRDLVEDELVGPDRAVPHGTGLASAAERVGRLARERPAEVALKLQDARAGLRHVRELARSHPRPRATAGVWTDGWETAYLRRWESRFTGELVTGRFVSVAARFDYQRLFGADHRTRWRTHVLATIAGSPPGTPARLLEEEALAAASRHGLDARSLTPEQIRVWVPEREQEVLDEREITLTVLIRSARLTPDLQDPATARLLLPSPLAHHSEIAASLAMNEAVARTGYAKNTDQLKTAVLRSHLALNWHLQSTCNTEVLDAAARDRGFTSAHEAQEALRPYFLRRHQESRTPKGAAS